MEAIKINFNLKYPHWLIKSKPQENGLWGMPYNCISIDRFVFSSEENQKKQSAMLIAMAEKHLNRNFYIRMSSEYGFVLYFTDNEKYSHYQFRYAEYELIGNLLIHKK